jgi:hypothetical protein
VVVRACGACEGDGADGLAWVGGGLGHRQPFEQRVARAAGVVWGVPWAVGGRGGWRA